MNYLTKIKNLTTARPFRHLGLTLSVLAITALGTSASWAITDADIANEVNGTNGFEATTSADMQFQKASHINEVDSLGTQNIDSFHARLQSNNATVLPSITQVNYIPIAGTITFFIKNEETLYPLGRRIGDSFVQSRLIRSQVYLQLGRHLMSATYSSEAAQINDLYNKAYELAACSSFNKKFGDRLVAADVNTCGVDVIWPEFRTINGEEILVPIVHLTDTTISGEGVTGHQVEFIGTQAQFANISIESGSIILRRDAVLQATENFFVEQGAIVNSEGDLNLAVGGTLLNHGTISAADSINIFASNYAQKTKVYLVTTMYGTEARLGQMSLINAGQDISITSFGNIVLLGAEAQAGNDIILQADGNIRVGTVTMSSQSSFRLSGTSTHGQSSTVDHVRSILTADENISLMAGGLIEINAATLHADAGHIELLAGLGISVLDEQGVSQSQFHQDFRNLSVDKSTYVTIAMRAILDAGAGIKIHSSAGDITLRATDITSVNGTTVNAIDGKINMLMTVENDHFSYSATNTGSASIRTESRGHNHETAVPNTIIGGFQAEALYGVSVEYEGNPELTLDEQVQVLSQFEGMEWMATVRSDYPDVEWDAIDLAYTEWDVSNAGLSPAALAVVTIIVTVATAGAGTSAAVAAGYTSTTVAAVAQAAITSFATTATTATINSAANGGDLLEATLDGIEATVSEDGLRSAAVAMVTAGAISYIDTQFFTPSAETLEISATAGRVEAMLTGVTDPTLLDAAAAVAREQALQLSLGMQAVQGMTHAAVSSGVQTLANGGSLGDFGDSFLTAAASNSINIIGRNLATEIGVAARSDPPQINLASQYIAHAALGCLTGGLTAAINESEEGTGCASGAGGAVIGEFISQQHQAAVIAELESDIHAWSNKYLGEPGTHTIEDFSRELQSLLDRGADLAKLTAAFTAFAVGGDVNIATASAFNAAEYNNGGGNADIIARNLGHYRMSAQLSRMTNVFAALGIDTTISSFDKIQRIANGEILDINNPNFFGAEAERFPTLTNLLQAAAEQGMQNLNANVELFISLVTAKLIDGAVSSAPITAALDDVDDSLRITRESYAASAARSDVDSLIRDIARYESFRLSAEEAGHDISARLHAEDLATGIERFSTYLVQNPHLLEFLIDESNGPTHTGHTDEPLEIPTLEGTPIPAEPSITNLVNLMLDPDELAPTNTAHDIDWLAPVISLVGPLINIASVFENIFFSENADDLTIENIAPEVTPAYAGVVNIVLAGDVNGESTGLGHMQAEVKNGYVFIEIYRITEEYQGNGLSVGLFEALIAHAGSNANEIEGDMGIDNLSAYNENNDINDTPWAIILDQLGYDTEYNENTNTMTSRRR